MEKLFSYFYKNKLQREAQKKGFVDLSEALPELKAFANLVSESDTAIDVGASLWGCGFIDNELLLPLQCRWSDDHQLNLDLLKILIIKSIAIKELEISFSFNNQSRNYPRLCMLGRMPAINQWLDSRFSQFKEFEHGVYERYQRAINSKYSNSVSAYNYWLKQIASRTPDSQTIQFKEKANDEPLEYLLATVPLPYRRNLINNRSTEQTTHLNTSPQKPKNRDRKEYIIDADANKKQPVNPVTHSFEKMETLDDYSGGNRISSGDNDLDEHSDALDEIEVNQFTNQGKASGIFRQDMQIIKQSEASTDSVVHDLSAYQYSEWNHTKKSYIKNFCHLYEVKPIPQDNTKWRNEILSQYKNEITYWSQYYAAIWNRPLWQNRKIEGNELDLDNLVRLAPHLKTISGSPPIYQKKESLELDAHLSIVIDISYSTDTWLNEQKIIDIIKNSLIVFGESIKSIIPNLSIGLAYSETHSNITYLPLLEFETAWNQVYSKLHEFKPRQYTRLGPPIRHATQILNSVQSKKPILIVVTDGKPTDLDPYEGRYGQEDVKKSLQEALNLGISPLLVGVTDLAPYSLAKILHNSVTIRDPHDFCLHVGHFLTNSIKL